MFLQKPKKCLPLALQIPSHFMLLLLVITYSPYQLAHQHYLSGYSEDFYIQPITQIATSDPILQITKST